MDFSVSDFNVRLRTIRIRELIVAFVVAFILTIVLGLLFPSLEAYEDLFILFPFFFLILFFVWALRGTIGLKDNFRKLF